MAVEFTMRPVEPEVDGDLLHGWLTHPKSAFWMMGGFSREAVVCEFERIAALPGHDALLGLHDGKPVFLAERYDPREYLSGVYSIRAGDVGMHFLVAPTERPVHGFTRAVLTAIMEMLFADPATERVVVEPDVRNTAVQALNREVGFEVSGTVSLPGKEAALSFCTRERYLAARGVAR